VAADNVVLRTSDGTSAAGTSDLEPGVKFPIFNRSQSTSVSAILKSTVPSGHSSQTAGGYEPGAELIWEHKLTDDFSLAGTWNLTRLKQEHFVWQRAASVSVNSSFKHRLSTFAELYVISPQELGAGNEWAVDAGVVRTIGDSLMLDVEAGHSVHGMKDWFITVGFSVRARLAHRVSQAER
jgi:Putative MetA-pathway of phenol degradation